MCSRINKLLLILTNLTFLKVLLRYGVCAGVEHKAVINSSLNLIIDVGANKGQFALACMFFAPNADVISFEPLSNPSKIFKNIFFKVGRIKLYNYAIGPNNETAYMHISAREDSSSLLKIGEKQDFFFPGTHEVSKEKVAVSLLNKFITFKDLKKPSMLKIDVQGYELKTLEGCEEFIRYFEYIYCECSFVEFYNKQVLAHEVIEWLYKREFVIEGTYNMVYDKEGKCLQADFLFINNLRD